MGKKVASYALRILEQNDSVPVRLALCVAVRDGNNRYCLTSDTEALKHSRQPLSNRVA